MPILTTPTAALRYETSGDPDHPPLVLLHGAMETFEACWKKPLPALAERHFVIGLDMRGHGESSNALDGLDTRQMADDVAALLDALGLAQAHVAGFSAGASVALYFALRHPGRARSLTLISNNVSRDTIRRETNFWDPERQRREEGLWWHFLLKVHRLPPERMLAWWAAEDAIRPDLGPTELRALTMPALVMGGDRDPIVPLEETLNLYRWLPNAQLCVIPGAGHGIHRHRLAMFLDAVQLFLRNT